jgi:uncharacterized protein YdeI (BOF family)
MKTHPLLALFCLLSTSMFAQTHVPVVIMVEDGDSHKKIAGANVSIKEAGYVTKVTDSNGKVSFDNIPVGEIEYNVSKEGYQFKSDRENVTTEIKSNTFLAMITKIPSPGDSKILVTGEVTDAEGRDVHKALVEVKIADVERVAETNESGNYSVDIVPNPKYPASQIRIEVKKGDCKKTELVDMPRTNMVYKDFKLDCESKPAGDVEKPAGTTTPTPKVLAEKTVDGFKLTVERFEQRSSTVTFYLILENMKAAESVRELGQYAQYCELIDQEGNGYAGTHISFGNSEGDWSGGKVIYNTPVKGFIQFEVGAVTINKAAFLKIPFRDGMEFTNIQLK